MDKIKEIYKLIVESFQTFSDKDAFMKAAAISYYTIFSLPALLLIVLNISGYFYKEDEVEMAIRGQFADFVGQSSAETIISTLDNLQVYEPKWWATAISIATILFTASTVFATLQSALNKMFLVDAKPDRNNILAYLRSRLLSLSVIGGFAFIVLISLTLNAALQFFGNQLELYIDEYSVIFVWIGSILIPLLINFIVFAMIFKVLPDVKIRWRNTWIAAGVTTLLFEVGKNLIAYYVGQTDVGGVYGAAGSIIVVMVWVFYATLIVLYGAVITKMVMKYQKDDIESTHFAVKKKTIEVEVPD